MGECNKRVLPAEVEDGDCVPILIVIDEESPAMDLLFFILDEAKALVWFF